MKKYRLIKTSGEVHEFTSYVEFLMDSEVFYMEVYDMQSDSIVKIYGLLKSIKEIVEVEVE